MKRMKKIERRPFLERALVLVGTYDKVLENLKEITNCAPVEDQIKKMKVTKEKNGIAYKYGHVFWFDQNNPTTLTLLTQRVEIHL
jgi:hypothetical protein